MITKYLPLQFLKKSLFHGSCEKMRYLLKKQDDLLLVCVYPGPFGYDSTPEEKKRFQTFPFSEEGYDEAIRYLNDMYQQIDWNQEEIPFFNFNIS